MTEKIFYIVKDMNCKFVAVFTDKEDCIRFIEDSYDSLVYDEVIL